MGFAFLAGGLLFGLAPKKKAGGGKTAGCPNQNQGRAAKPVAREQSPRIYLASTDGSSGRQPRLRLPAPAIPPRSANHVQGVLGKSKVGGQPSQPPVPLEPGVTRALVHHLVSSQFFRLGIP